MGFVAGEVRGANLTELKFPFLVLVAIAAASRGTGSVGGSTD